ncbi:hypothetical protein [Piscinibacter sp. XHJ-5]|uniref:hypothetical protein n=1 Tax=Piscinibacter sp. XHJ-5 TaxID=3037797 RepID=UPI002452834A|nr:hypothetical protein [Piscinibacter sp. XHJ-5]
MKRKSASVRRAIARNSALRLALLAALSAAPAGARAGEVFGTISENNKPVPNESVSIRCDAGTSDTRSTDEFGSFRLFVGSEGPCKLTVRGLEGVTVQSYRSPQRYNLEIRKSGSNTSLQRR